LVTAAIVLGIAAVGLMLWMPFQQQAWAAEEIQKLGGRVSTRPNPPGWLRSIDPSLGLEMFNEVVAVDLHSIETTDADLESLSSLNGLKTLWLFGPKLTDASLDHLDALSELEDLMLTHCSGISKTRVEQLQERLPDLQVMRRGPALLGVNGSPAGGVCRIARVQSGSGAAKAGLRTGDVITHFDAQPVTDFDSLIALIAEKLPDEKIPVQVTRGKKSITLTVVLGRW
jgi:membrane-associated protease RseP (regulator of RpoE activity)